MKPLVLLFILLFLTPSTSMGKERGSSIEELFSLSNMAHVDGRHEEAIRGYRNMEKKGLVNPDTYYNLANSYAKTGKVGLAILYYEKSLKLSPNAADVENNLAVMRERIAAPTAGLDARSPWEKLFSYTTFKGCADFTIFIYFLTFCTLIVMLLKKNEKLRSRMRRAGAILAVLSSLSFIITLINLYEQEKVSYAIVVGEGVNLYEAPLEQAASSEILTEGSKVKVIDDSKSWLKVSSTSGTVGWVQKKGVGTI